MRCCLNLYLRNSLSFGLPKHLLTIFCIMGTLLEFIHKPQKAFPTHSMKCKVHDFFHSQIHLYLLSLVIKITKEVEEAFLLDSVIS